MALSGRRVVPSRLTRHRVHGSHQPESLLLSVESSRSISAAHTDRDYGFRHGVGVQEIRGIAKLQLGTGILDTSSLVDAGVFTIFTAAVADA